MICSEASAESVMGIEALVNSDVVSNALCSETKNISNRSSNNTMMFMQFVFNNIRTCSQEAKRISSHFLMIIYKTQQRVVVSRQVVPLHIMQLIKIKLMDMFRISRCRIMPKIMQLGAGILKKVGIQMQCLADFTSETKLLNLSLGVTTYFRSLFNIQLTCMLNITQCLNTPKIAQIGSGIFKTWTVKHSNSIFGPPCMQYNSKYLPQTKCPNIWHPSDYTHIC